MEQLSSGRENARAENPQTRYVWTPARLLAALPGYDTFYHHTRGIVSGQSLSMRVGMCRFTRLTNGFSKKIENHAYSVALYFMHYNFIRIHTTLRVTPAMEAGITDHVWAISEIL
jgi:hypothetical protein